jgi:proline racemase
VKVFFTQDVNERQINAVNAQLEFHHPDDTRIRGCHHVLLTDGVSDDGVAPGTVVIHPGWLDRSPCGTGTSARLACLAADGKLAPGETWRQASIIGSLFEGTYETLGNRIIPTITGTAYVTAQCKLVISPVDPYTYGIRSSGSSSPGFRA